MSRASKENKKVLENIPSEMATDEALSRVLAKAAAMQYVSSETVIQLKNQNAVLRKNQDDLAQVQDHVAENASLLRKMKGPSSTFKKLFGGGSGDRDSDAAHETNGSLQSEYEMDSKGKKKKKKKSKREKNPGTAHRLDYESQRIEEEKRIQAAENAKHEIESALRRKNDLANLNARMEAQKQKMKPDSYHDKGSGLPHKTYQTLDEEKNQSLEKSTYGRALEQTRIAVDSVHYNAKAGSKLIKRGEKRTEDLTHEMEKTTVDTQYLTRKAGEF